MGFRLAALGPLLGKGIFTTDSKEWETSRALVRPNLVKAQISDLSKLEKHVNQLLAHVPKDGSTVDLQDLFFDLSFDTSSELLLGQLVVLLQQPKIQDKPALSLPLTMQWPSSSSLTIRLFPHFIFQQGLQQSLQDRGQFC